MKKKKSAGRWLLMIPLQGLLSILIVIAGILGDRAFINNVEMVGNGHPAPFFTVLGIVIAVGLFVLVTIVSIVITMVKAAKNKRDE